MGRTKPRTISELMDVANNLADGEDACHNKREISPEDDRQTVIAARGADLANMTITTLTTK
jgi:hypothetical protein